MIGFDCCDCLNIFFYYLNSCDPTQIIISLFTFVSNVLKLDEDNQGTFISNLFFGPF